MTPFSQKKQVLSLAKPYLEKTYGVKRMGFFGSYVKGKQKIGSDIDLLVQFNKPVSFFEFIELEGYLTKKLGVKVDLVTDKALKPGIGKKILSEAVYL